MVYLKRLDAKGASMGCDMSDELEPATLIDGVTEWPVVLRDRTVIHVGAHAFGFDGADCVFSVFAEGSPPRQIEVLRIPRAIVYGFEGGPSLEESYDT
jgi:hypothetical protein